MTDQLFTPTDESILGGAATSDPDAERVEARRLQRLADGVRGLRTRSGPGAGAHILMIIGGILAPLGLIAVLLGWWGAANTPNLFEQVPYLISGGLLGLALVFLGGFFYFAHWMTELVREHRTQSTAMLEAVGRLEEALARATVVSGNGHVAAAPPPPAARSRIETAATLVATARGSMAHRPECVVVAGKLGLRPVGEADGLEPCKLCDPYGE